MKFSITDDITNKAVQYTHAATMVVSRFLTVLICLKHIFTSLKYYS